MFGMSFFSRPKAAKPARPFYRPRVDELESRLCLDGSTVSLIAQVGAGHVAQLTGSVSGGQVAGVTVTFSGSVVGATQTDQNGNYVFTTNTAVLGSITAQYKPVGGTAVTATAVLSEPITPYLSMSMTYGDGDSVTLTGTLLDIDKAGQTVVFTGVTSGSVVTDSDGNFSFTTEVDFVGAIDATVTDLWSQTSNTAEVVVQDAAPVIVTFSGVHQGGPLWYFSGTVTADDPSSVTITFGGLNGAVAGRTATVNADGTFSISFILRSNVRGTITAIATDAFGQESQIAYFVVA
jgi:hypothetical protein